MGVYIKGMEMPKPGHIVLVEIDENGDVFAAYDGGRTKLTQHEAVPVPPHGDLIERKAICLTDFEIAMCDCNYKKGMKMLLEKAESAPTIIPTSEEGEA